jgi:hypothetical protein
MEGTTSDIIACRASFKLIEQFIAFEMDLTKLCLLKTWGEELLTLSNA